MPGPYYLIVENSRGPRRAHGTIEEARTEAARLFEFFKRCRWVRILETIETTDATHFGPFINEAKGTEKIVPRVKWKRRWNIEIPANANSADTG